MEELFQKAEPHSASGSRLRSSKKRMLNSIKKLMHPLFMRSIHE